MIDEIITIANDSAQSNMLAIEDTVNDCYEQHKAVWEKWDKGEPVDHWRDDEGNMCIRYANGEWFHYRINPGAEGEAPFLEWW